MKFSSDGSQHPMQIHVGENLFEQPTLAKDANTIADCEVDWISIVMGIPATDISSSIGACPS